MKVALAVQGRFHAFDLGKAMLRRGHEVTVLTNYPRWAVERFGFPRAQVRSFGSHGALSKAAYGMLGARKVGPEPWLNPLFGKWAAQELEGDHWDVIQAWTGVAEEVLRRPRDRNCLRLVMRGSSHIRVQDEILEQEEQRTGIRLNRPSKWSIEREEREYRLADQVVVLSTFARNSFLAQGFPPTKIWNVPLGADLATFRPTRTSIEARCRRILSGQPLRILFVGTLSLRKGLWDARTIASQLPSGRFSLRFVGPIMSETKKIARELSTFAEIVPKVPQDELPGYYADSDIFMFPTLEDGFAVVLAQARASALPILTTPNCSGPDLIREAESGWIRPVRSPDTFVETLLWCDAHRPEVAEMVRHSYESPHIRAWDDVVKDFEQVCWSAP
jgi:glycosyltransferase involved in cell wall biosynthesis